MQRFVVSTDTVAEGERFPYWRDAVMETMVGVNGEPNDDRDTPFESAIVASVGRSLHRFRYRGSRHRVFRQGREIARRSWDDQIWVYHEIGEGSWFRDGRREFVTRPGDLIIADPTNPFETEALRRHDNETWCFPRALFDPHLAAGQRPRSLVLSNAPGINGMVLAYLDAFGRQFDLLGDDEAGMIADNFCRLLAVACGGAAGEHRGAIASARVEEAKRYVCAHLTDPGLTPEKAARALKISVRQLHLLFEPTGTSFAQYVLSRRLEECRAALMNPIGGRSVTDVAFAWGFNSLATFYRTFQQAFGVAPGALRASAASPTAS